LLHSAVWNSTPRWNRARILAKQWNPIPAILHREAPCLKHRIFLIRDFTSLKLIRGVLFWPKLFTNGLSWHTISWHYTFKFLGIVKIRVVTHTSTIQSWNDANSHYVVFCKNCHLEHSKLVGKFTNFFEKMFRKRKMYSYNHLFRNFHAVRYSLYFSSKWELRKDDPFVSKIMF
jgi:hypothetical protein